MSEKRINVLLVDDEEALLSSMQRRLQFRDFNVIAVNRGEKALKAVREHPVDVAVVDIKMPGINGKEVLEALKAEYPWMEVLILTGHGSFNPEEEGVSDKIHSCLVKPCDLATLQEALKDAYKKTVINRSRIRPRDPDDAYIKGAAEGSPDVALKK
ncbi:MAG: response regulator [Deltaproteobacteria bacterium]|nr:response regulator [Deltaproteobacteria bacterium]